MHYETWEITVANSNFSSFIVFVSNKYFSQACLFKILFYNNNSSNNHIKDVKNKD